MRLEIKTGTNLDKNVWVGVDSTVAYLKVDDINLVELFYQSQNSIAIKLFGTHFHTTLLNSDEEKATVDLAFNQRQNQLECIGKIEFRTNQRDIDYLHNIVFLTDNAQDVTFSMYAGSPNKDPISTDQIYIKDWSLNIN